MTNVAELVEALLSRSADEGKCRRLAELWHVVNLFRPSRGGRSKLTAEPAVVSIMDIHVVVLLQLGDALPSLAMSQHVQK